MAKTAQNPLILRFDLGNYLSRGMLQSNLKALNPFVERFMRLYALAAGLVVALSGPALAQDL
jgi:hypothetical protein